VQAAYWSSRAEKHYESAQEAPSRFWKNDLVRDVRALGGGQGECRQIAAHIKKTVSYARSKTRPRLASTGGWLFITFALWCHCEVSKRLIHDQVEFRLDTRRECPSTRGLRLLHITPLSSEAGSTQVESLIARRQQKYVQDLTFSSRLSQKRKL
jgi:hypothetical protein